MISVNQTKKIREDGEDKYSLMEIAGLSSDEKPTDEINNTKIDNGSIFIEMDTGKIYMFDLENTTWEEF